MPKEPSKPRAAKTPPVDETKVDKEVEELFNADTPLRGEEPVHDQFDTFIRSTAKSKIVVIVPLYGYWADVKGGFFDDEKVLQAVTNRISSSAHTLYCVVVAEPPRMSKDTYATLNGRYVGGNVKGVSMPVGSTYPEYVAKGIEVALEETDAQYVIIYNPWGILQRHGIDNLVDRVNLNGNAPVICGFDMQAEIAPDEFDSWKANAPREWVSYRAKHLLSFNLIGMRRFIAEMCTVDPRFKTQPFAERDYFQQIASHGFDAVTSERVPTFFFQVPWEEYVPDEFYKEDMEAFVAKWGFRPADIKLR